MIELKGVTVKDGAKDFEAPVDLRLNNGKIYGVCAKAEERTLLFELLAAMRLPSSGEVLINGFDTVREEKKARSLLSPVPDEALLYPSMTVLEYLLFIADAYGIDSQRSLRKISEALDFTELSVKRNLLIKTLSFYEKKRLSLAHALLSPGNIYLINTPFQGLTPPQKKHFEELLEDTFDGSTAILFDATPNDISVLCNAVYTFCDGGIHTVGSQNTDDLNTNKEEEDNV